MPEPDSLLLGAVDEARAALLEITPESTVGDPAGFRVEGEHVLSLRFENRLPGYPGWFWTVSLSREPETDRVNVLEAELMPGDGALLAPDWIPWADRLAEYQAQRKAEREAAGEEADAETEGDDEDDLDVEDLGDDFDDDELVEVDDELDEDGLEEDDEDDADEDDDEAEDDDELDESAEIQAAEEAALNSED